MNVSDMFFFFFLYRRSASLQMKEILMRSKEKSESIVLDLKINRY